MLDKLNKLKKAVSKIDDLGALAKTVQNIAKNDEAKKALKALIKVLEENDKDTVVAVLKKIVK